MRPFAQTVQLERLTGTTDDGLEERPAYGDPLPVTVTLMPPSAEVERAAALRNETVSYVALFPDGAGVRGESCRVTVGGKLYRVGRVTRIPAGEVVQLTEA